jgi:ABC transporter substrate binding protein
LQSTVEQPHHPAMDRRRFLLTSLAGALAAPLAGEAQQAGKVYRIGFLRPGPPPKNFIEAFQQGLRERGYVDGQNVVIEFRFGDVDRLAEELVRSKVDVILAGGGAPPALAAKKATTSVPIVFVAVVDPVELGLVAAWGAREEISREWPTSLLISLARVSSCWVSSFPSSGELQCFGKRRIQATWCSSKVRRSQRAR